MLRATCAAALISATLLSGCSGQRTLNEEELKSAATEMISIASEGELLAAAAAENRAPAKYARAHPEYLRKQAEAVATGLKQGLPDARAQKPFDRLRLSATRLMETLDALPATGGDPRWQQSRSQLEHIRREAEEIGRTF
jgi:hypothetical protein